MKTKKMYLWLIAMTLLASCEPDRIVEDTLTTEEESTETVASTTNSSPNGRTANGGSFTILSYNVAGLPDVLSSSNPQANTPRIGQLIRDYDIVHVQEDFNYHAALYANDNHPFRTPTSGGVPFGDGLNTLSRFPYTDFKRIKWNSCNGTDCLTPKGFTFSRIRIDEGLYVDFYNAHPNAGTTDADLAARRSNITQLSQYILQNSTGNAVVVMGDFNCRYTRSGDNIRELIQNNGMTDAWIKLIRNDNYPPIGAPAITCQFPNLTNPCEVVDKIFFRSNKLINFTPSNYSVDDPDFVTPSGESLSDHYPLTTTLTWSLGADYLMSDLIGGPHGTPFNNLNLIPAGASLTKIGLRAGSRVDRVNVQLSNGTVFSHGGNGGTEKTLTLAAGEFVVSVTLSSAQYQGRTRIFFIEYRTNQGRTLSGGTRTGETVTYTAPAGWQVAGFYGNAGSEVDKLGLIYTRR
jgi:endonuclease/exonuclease/phosphatase family metal-dependent hydrolase